MSLPSIFTLSQLLGIAFLRKLSDSECSRAKYAKNAKFRKFISYPLRPWRLCGKIFRVSLLRFLRASSRRVQMKKLHSVSRHHRTLLIFRHAGELFFDQLK